MSEMGPRETIRAVKERVSIYSVFNIHDDVKELQAQSADDKAVTDKKFEIIQKQIDPQNSAQNIVQALRSNPELLNELRYTLN